MVKVKELLTKKKILNMDYMSFVLEASASSCQFGDIVEHQGGSRYFKTRANTNVILALPLGSGKTTNLLQIPEKMRVLVNDVTFPGMVGSITKNGDFVEGATLKAAGKVLLLDEFNKVPKDVKDAMNNLLEQREHPRNLGFMASRPFKKNTVFSRVHVDKGYISVKSKFSCIASTMYLKMKEGRGASISDKAWFTRFIPVRFVPDIDYYKKLSIGQKALVIEPHIRRVDEFVFKDYLKASDIFWKAYESNKAAVSYFQSNALERGATTRVLQDLVRLSAFIASLDNRTKVRLKDFETVMRFFPMMIMNIIQWDMTEHEYSVVEGYNSGLTQTEISAKIGLTQSTVSYILSRMKEKGMIV